MTSVKEKIHLSKKKKKSREILDRLKDCKATTVRKDGNFWSSKNQRRQMVQILVFMYMQFGQ